MRAGPHNFISSLPVVAVVGVTWTSLFTHSRPFGSIFVGAAPSIAVAPRDLSDWNASPPPEVGPPGAYNAIVDKAYLPAQIGGIVGAYALSLVLVAALLLILSKKRREQLRNSEEEEQQQQRAAEGRTQQQEEPRFPGLGLLLQQQQQQQQALHDSGSRPVVPQSPKSPVRNFSYPSPTSEKGANPYVYPVAPNFHQPGVDPNVDQDVVRQDREMAQAQLEEMYKYVMEHEEAKEAGIELAPPPVNALQSVVAQRQSGQSQASGGQLSKLAKKEKNKPASLNLSSAGSEKSQSRASSILSALRSPRKKGIRGVNISSPIMTPNSGTFPSHPGSAGGEEMNHIPPRQYAPASPPPIPTDQAPFVPGRRVGPASPLTPEMSPQHIMTADMAALSIDERLKLEASSSSSAAAQAGQQQQIRGYGHSRNTSAAPSEPDPNSAVSESSTTPLMGLPSSPKPGANRFPSLISQRSPVSSPRQASFASIQSTAAGVPLPTSPPANTTSFASASGSSTGINRPNAPSAVRTGGALPLRAYESALSSPSQTSVQTKQTVFERTGPLSPMGGLRSPVTGGLPYSPYQPYTPIIPITPTLVTKADRKRMKKFEPKTPTTEMVKSTEEIW